MAGHQEDCAERGGGERDQQAALGGGLDAVAGVGGEGEGGIAQRLQPGEDRLGRGGAVVPFDRDALGSEVDAGAAHAALAAKALLDGGDAGAAMDALDHEVHGRDAFDGVAHEIAEFGRVAHRRSLFTFGR